MKKFLFLSIVVIALITGCDSNKSASNSTDESTVPTTADSLRIALANQDSLLALVNDISADMASIKEMENILSNPSGLNGEAPSARQKIKDDIEAIQATLQQRRERMEELERKLRTSTANNKILQTTIETLKQQINEQEGTIASLQEQLGNAMTTIGTLEKKVDNLNETLSAVNEAKEQAEQKNVQLTDEINTCFYAIGSKKELKDQNLIETGFLRKTKILPGDIDLRFFHQADKRTLQTIDLHSKKVKILTDQPKNSYTITEEANGAKILNILDPKTFWEKSNYLVIQID